MKRRIALCIAVSLCAGVYAGNNPGIYKKGWIDFNKNGVKDIYMTSRASRRTRSLSTVWRRSPRDATSSSR